MSHSGINVFLERWSDEAAPEIVENHLQTFSYMKDLYPELGKYGDQHDLLVHFHSNPETIWIVNVNVSNDIMFVGRDEVLPALHGGNSSYRTHATGTEAEYSSFEDLRSLPSLGSAYNDPSNALDALSNVSNESSSSLGITFSTSGFGPLDSLPAFPSPLPQDPDATPKPGPSQSPNPQPTSGGLNQELEALEDFPAPSSPRRQFRALPKDDLNLSVHDWGMGERLGLGPAIATFRKIVVGLALVIPSTLCLSSEHLELDGSKAEMFQESGSDLLSKQRNTRDMLESPKSCDICVLLNFDAPEVSAKLTEQSQVEITPQVQEQLTQEAIFNLLLEIELTVKSLNVLQYRVLMTEEGLREHETTFLAFLDMGFEEEAKNEPLNFRGYLEGVRVLVMSMDMWEWLRDGTLDPEGRSKGKGKGKGKGKEKAWQ